mmetsp:Transcript_8303/g.12785  ORF Transcript_8303/g.12785 Transcript_8303/m.12785 type:complete len:286 (-) Transcript_8303:51-908(-)
MISNFHGNSKDIHGGLSSASANCEYTFGSNDDVNYVQPKARGKRNKKNRWFSGSKRAKEKRSHSVEHSNAEGSSCGQSSNHSNMTSDSSTVFKMLKDDESAASSMMTSSFEGSALSGISSLIGEKFLRSSKRKKNIPKNIPNSLLGDLGGSQSTDEDNDSLTGLVGDDELYYDANKKSSPLPTNKASTSMKASVTRNATSTISCKESSKESYHNNLKSQQEYQPYQEESPDQSQDLNGIENTTENMHCKDKKSSSPSNSDVADTDTILSSCFCCGVSLSEFMKAF